MNFLVNREKLAWAAGLFEGEGCFSGGVTKQGSRWLRTSIGMTDEDTVRQFHAIIGFGRIYVRSPSNPKHKIQWTWVATTFEEVQATMAMLWPWLKTRRRAKATELLRSYRTLEPAIVKIRLNRTEGIKRALIALADKPLWGRRWHTGRTQLGIAAEFGVSAATVTLIKQQMGA